MQLQLKKLSSKSRIITNQQILSRMLEKIFSFSFYVFFFYHIWQRLFPPLNNYNYIINASYMLLYFFVQHACFAKLSQTTCNPASYSDEQIFSVCSLQFGLVYFNFLRISLVFLRLQPLPDNKSLVSDTVFHKTLFSPVPKFQIM